MSLLVALIDKTSHIFAGIYFIFPKNAARLDLKYFQFQIQFERVLVESEARNCFQRQSLTKYLRQTPAFM